MNQFIVLIEAEMTSREWYHRWIYQQAKSEVDMQTNRKPHLKLIPEGWHAKVSHLLMGHQCQSNAIGKTPKEALKNLDEFLLKQQGS